MMPARSPHWSRQPIRLSEFDGQRMAVIVSRPSGRVVLRGTAEFVRDDAIGNTLNIRIDEPEPGHPVLVIAERSWRGRIVPDFHHGCKFCLTVDQA
ncbi:MAG: hypothetical protein MUF48_03605 [Pirellulaceae bacterium]|nr:hypothetical protein [Pirellulaceae bacterium]